MKSSATHLQESWQWLDFTHWGRVTHICVSKLTIIGSDNGLSPDRRQAIIWTIAGILLIGPLGTNFNEILIAIQTFSFKKMHLKMLFGKWRPFCPGLNVWMLSSVFRPSDSHLGHMTWNIFLQYFIEAAREAYWTSGPYMYITPAYTSQPSDPVSNIYIWWHLFTTVGGHH